MNNLTKKLNTKEWRNIEKRFVTIMNTEKWTEYRKTYHTIKQRGNYQKAKTKEKHNPNSQGLWPVEMNGMGSNDVLKTNLSH